jgi:hypothetical protein
MAAAIRVSGTAFFKVDGVSYSLRGTLTVQPLSLEREAVVGMDGIHGYAERSIVPFITVELTKTPELNMTAIGAITNSTITAEFSDDTTYALRNAWFAGQSEVNGGEGTVTLRFEGLSCVEL